MSKHKGKLKSISFYWKLLATYTAIVMMAIIALGTYSYQSSMKTLEEHTRSSLSGSLELMKENIMYTIMELNKIADQIYLDETIQRAFLREFDAEQSYYFYHEYLIPKFESTLKMSTDFLWITLYANNQTIYEKYYSEEKKSLTTGKGYELRKAKEGGELWYNQLNYMPVKRYWLEVEEDKDNGALSLIMPLINFNSITPIGWLRVNIKKKDVFRALDSQKLGVMSNLFIVDNETKKVVYSNDRESIPEKVSDEEYLIVEQLINNDEWSLIAFIPKIELEKNTGKIRKATLLACAITFFVIMFISFALTKMLTKRINKISRSMNAFKEGSFHKRINFKSNDEFAVIAQSFNEMAQTIERLIYEVYMSDISKKEAELQMLQNQINPHFLYNTLSTISRLAKLGELDQMHQMVLGLSKFYRLVMNTGVMIIPLELELQQVQAYLDIQRTKYGDALKIVYDIKCDTSRILTLKLLLQPFLENALIHAWHHESLYIYVRCWSSSDRVYIEIEDNGCGIEPDKVKKLNENPESVGYGIRNVTERIRLYYGPDYGVRISSQLGEGTFIHIEIPLEMKED
ncbi:histidine kinase [Paenibacillus sp. LHD-117]|uniref:cache domain-containing sensor histidine kinase n=1 Tax=Paenibacillus sp. LHD-117 TaxID=3071412 RepID=UPI0027E03D14|nr:histidine kinase [Paenibacillus sp. LHD-117]MDQ6422966.1 histidine kinase [Paenibacillus sp. LHD-117]